MATMTLNLPLRGGESLQFVRNDPVVDGGKAGYKLTLRRVTKKYDKMLREDVVTDEEMTVDLTWDAAVDLLKGVDKLT